MEALTSYSCFRGFLGAAKKLSMKRDDSLSRLMSLLGSLRNDAPLIFDVAARLHYNPDHPWRQAQERDHNLELLVPFNGFGFRVI